MSQEARGPSSQVKTDEEAKETRTTKVPIYMTYQRGTRRLYAVDRQVFSP